MGKFRFVLSNFWLWATVLMGCIFAENLAIFTPNPREGYNNITFYMIAVCCFLCLGIYLYLEHKRNHVKFDKILLPIIVGLGIVMLITIFMQSTETFVYENGKNSVTVSFSVHDKVKYGLRLIFLLAFSYITTFTMFANRANNRSLLWLPIILLDVAYVSVGYSLFTESTTIMAYFRSVSRLSIKSFYLNPNTFGLTLLLGIMCCMVINHYKPNVFTFVTIPLFLFLIILTNSAASILVALVIVPLYFVIEIFKNVKKHLLTTSLISLAAIIGIAVFVISINSLADQKNLFVENIIKSFKKCFDEIHYDTFSGRTGVFAGFIRYGSDLTLHALFGRGYGTSDVYIPAIYSALRNGPHSMSCENGFVQIFVTYGLVGIFAYIGLLGVFFYSCVKLFVFKQRTFAATYGLIVLGLVAHSFAETNIFYDLGFKETAMTLIFLMPPIVKAKYLNKRGKAKIQETIEYKTNVKFDAFKVGEIISMILLASIVATAAAFMSPYGINNPKVFLIVIFSLLGTLLIFPYLISLWLKSVDPVKRVIHVALNLIGLLAAVYVVFVLAKDTGPVSFNYILSAVAAFIFIIIDLILYATFRKDFFFSYLKITFIRPIVALFPSFIFGMFLTTIFGLIFLPQGQFGPLETFGLIVFALISIFIGIFFIPYRPMKKYLNYINDATISRWQTFMARGDR